MGAPKQKWTADEEAALRAGVSKHGAGKWRTILKDPEFSGVLRLRSNVDLKDKWRNMSVTANGWGSRERGRLALKRSQPPAKHDDNTLALSTVVAYNGDEIVDATPLSVSNESVRLPGPKKSSPRLENLILEAITSLQEPAGSNKTAIATYIEDEHPTFSLPNLKRVLSLKLKALMASGKLIKVKRKYRLAPPLLSLEQKCSKVLPVEDKQKETIRVETEAIPLTKSQINAELAKIRNMNAQEAAAAAARAIAEAEAAMAEAEEAAREAEAAEHDAEQARLFAEAAIVALKNRNAGNMMVRV